MKDKKRISTEQMKELTGATLRQLQWWHEQGICDPAHGLFQGARAYSEAQIATVSRLVRLRKLQVPLRWASKCVNLEWSAIRMINNPVVIDGVLYIPRPVEHSAKWQRRGGSTGLKASFGRMDKQAMSDPMIARGRTEA